MTRAVVFAYHNVGVRCLSVLLAHGVNVQLVLTHDDDPKENIWFNSVAKLAARNRLPYASPGNPNEPHWLQRIRSIQPEFIFSFYYRHMLGAELLACASRGAYNMHGSLLPKYRGRVPVNWAIINGERHTGATLHQMEIKPDAGAIAAQQAVPILPDDTALDVFQKVTVAAELALDKSLPSILDGTVQLTPQQLTAGSYFGGRKAEDGRINWQHSALAIHNLIRAVAPPYPGAFTELQGKALRILSSRIPADMRVVHTHPCLYWDAHHLYAELHDGSTIEIIESEHNGRTLDQPSWLKLFSQWPVNLS
ncbi:MAG: formyltransferase [Steroidobacteraceae bacterium]